MPGAPKVSVCLLCWNHELYIAQCLNSVIHQSYPNIELLLVDNGSTDASYEIAQHYLDNCSLESKAFKNASNKTVAANLNFLAKQAAGKYIIVLSTDDWLETDCVAKKIAHLEQSPDIGMLYNGGKIYYQQDGHYEQVDDSNFKRGHIAKELLNEEGVLFFIGCCYPKAVLEQVGGWDETLAIEDLDLFIRIAQLYPIDYIREPLAYYRKVSTSAANNIEFMVKGWEQYYRKYKGTELANMDHWLAKKYRAYAALAIDRSNPTLALNLLVKSIRLYPAYKSNYRTLFYLIKKMFRR